MFDWASFKRRRFVALAMPRLVGHLTPDRAKSRVHDDSDTMEGAEPFLVRWPAGTPLPRVGLVQDVVSDPYWTKYRHFLQANGFPYQIVDIHSRAWLESLEGVDIVVWRPSSSPSELEEARRKVFFLNDFLSMRTYPSARALQLYEDKILQTWILAHLGAEAPRTIISFSEADALAGLTELGSQVVWKINTGSASLGVERLSAAGAQRAAKRTFSLRGRRTYWPHLNQQGYVYAQALESDLRTDMRIIVVGPLLLGYYRDAPPGDFRASGMNRLRWGALPPSCLEEAWNLASRLDVGAVALDFLVDEDCSHCKVIEFSSFIRVDAPMELSVDGVAGVYVRHAPGNFEFRPGRYWLPELVLAQALAQTFGVDADRLLLDALDGSLTEAESQGEDVSGSERRSPDTVATVTSLATN
jgi:glutathione synthase/RimK-type ligase-like ATP-grasp enzyme